MAIIAIKPLDARIPQWDFTLLADRLCPFCKETNEPVLMRPDKLSVAFCQACCCWYVDKIPSIPDIMKVYNGYWYTHHPTDLSEKVALNMIKNARKGWQSNWQLNTLSTLLGGINGKRVLDIGCGYGQFLLMARSAGADVIGCDLSPEACEFAKGTLGIPVYNSNIKDVSSSIGKVDAVVMRDLIEHLVDPFADIQTVYDILKPGGLLLLHTPNGGEAGKDVGTAKNWVGFRVDLEHFQYLSPHTVNWLSKKYDLGIELLETNGFPGLQGIDSLPKRKSRSVSYAKEMVKTIPGIQGMVRILRGLKSEIVGGNRDLRLGSYHLFTVLRKIEAVCGCPNRF